MANKRINDLPEETSPASTDVFAVDGATTRKASRANVLKENLEAIRGLTSAADKGIQFTGAGTAATYDLTAAGKALLDDADATAQRTTLGVVIGTDVQAFDADLSAVAGLATTGLIARTGAGTAATRTLQSASAGLTWTNGDGIAGNPVPVFANDLAALEGLASTGIARRTGTDTWSVGTAVTNSELATMAAFTFKGNNTSGSATPTDVDIAALTSKASPAASDLVMISDQAASGAWKKVLVSALASAGSVASINGQTGALVSYFPPQGRLTLASGVPVMSASQAAQTTVYYTPYVGNMVPIYDGTNMVPTAVAEISQATTDTTKSPAAVTASKVYDIFVWNDAGTIRATRGPAWTNNTTRGYTFTMVNGIALNTSAITNGPAASRGTWVGTIASNASSTIDYIFGAAASGGTAAVFGVWNAYNRVSVGTTVTDNGAQYAGYTSATPRQARASAGNQISFVFGAQEDTVSFAYASRSSTVNVSQAATNTGVGFDVTNAFSCSASAVQTSAAVSVTGGNTNAGIWNVGIGVHVLAALEASDSTNANNFNVSSNNSLSASLRM